HAGVIETTASVEATTLRSKENANVFMPLGLR
ncbi:MAG: hypothetical protein RLZZ456_766, partial [Pseudomonadota bacterium]